MDFKLTLGALALLVAATFAVPITNDRAIDVGQEYVYDYETLVTAGAVDPTSYASIFGLKGHLHIQGVSPGQVAIKFKDLKLATYNGEYDFLNYPEFKFVKHAELTAGLSRPFLVNYDGHRQVSSIVVSDNDQEWEINVKKAAASFLQLHLDEIKAGKKAFTVKENSIHGTCPISYEVTPCHVHPENTIVVRKYRHNFDCEKREVRHRSPLAFETCPGVNVANDPIHSSSFQIYHIVNDGGKAKVSEVEVLSQTLYRPFGNKGFTQYSFVNQTVRLEKVQAIATPFAVAGTPNTITDLSYHFDSDRFSAQKEVNLKEAENIFYHDIDFKVSQETIVDNLIQFLDKNVETLEKSHVYNDIKPSHRFALYHGLMLVGKLDYDHLKSAYERITAETSLRYKAIKELYLDLLSTAGSSPSALFLLNLLKTSPADKPRLLRGLSILPFYIRFPTEALVEKFASLKDIVTKEDEPITYRMSRLAFANLVGLTCKHDCSDAFLNKWVDTFYKKFNEATTEKDQLLYLQMLTNVGKGKIPELLLPVVTGEKKVPTNVRILAMGATHNLGHTDREKFFDTYLGIFFNRLEHYEVRITAFDLIMHNRPNFDEMQQIGASLWKEPSQQVAHYVYTTYKSLTITTHPCLRKASKDASFLVKYMRYNPALSINTRVSGHYAADYVDNNFNFGHQTITTIVASEDSALPRSVEWTFNTQVAGYNADYLSIYIRQEGLSDAIYDQLFTFDPKELKQADLKSILDKIHVIARPTVPLKIEVEIYVGDHVLFSAYFDETTFDKIADSLKDIKSLQSEHEINHHRAYAATFGMYEEPNDFGTPVTIANTYSAELSLHGKFKSQMSEATLTRDSEFDIHTRSALGSYMINYNPITGFMHRVRHGSVFIFNVPRDVKISLDFAQQQLKFSSGRPDSNDPFEIVSHAGSKVDIKGFGSNKVDKFLTESCSFCKSDELISNGPDHRKNLILINHDSARFGDHHHAEIFDCEKKGSYGQFLHALKGFFNPTTKSAKHDYSDIAFLGVSNFLDYLIYAPTGYTCGIYYTHTESVKNPASRVEGLIKLKLQEGDDAVNIFAGKKYMGRAVITFKGVPGKSEDRKVDASVVYKYDKFHQNSEFKLKLVRAATGDKGEYVVCVDYQKHYPEVVEDLLTLENNDALYETKSEISLLWGESDGGKCPVNKAAIKFNIHSTRSDKQKALVEKHNVWPYNKCQKDKENKKDWPGKFTPFTEACFYAAAAQTTPLKTEVKIQYANLPPALTTAYNRFLTLTKVALYPYWDSESGEGEHSSEEHSDHDNVQVPPGEIQVVRELSPSHTLADIHIHSHSERNHFENVDYSLLPVEPFTQNVRFFKPLITAFELGLIDSCAVSPHFVHTLDNVTFHADIPDCYTLISSDCSEKPKYAIFLKKLSDETVGLKLLVGGHSLEIGNGVKVNGEVVEVGATPYAYPADEKLQYFQVAHRNSIYDIFSPMHNILIYYTGNYASILVPSNFRNHHCGICGNYDKEVTGEFVGPDKCVLKSGQEFVNSYALRDGCSAPEYVSCKN